MSADSILKGDLQPGNARYAIAMSRFNSFIVERLLDGALEALTAQGVERDRIRIVQVPGAWELAARGSKRWRNGGTSTR